MRYRASLGAMTDFEVADVLGCVGADLIDVAQRVEGLPPNLQAAAAAIELDAITTATDALSVEVARVLAVVVAEVEGCVHPDT